MYLDIVHTLGLYSAFRACKAIVLRSRRADKLTVATMFLQALFSKVIGYASMLVHLLQGGDNPRSRVLRSRSRSRDSISCADVLRDILVGGWWGGVRVHAAGERNRGWASESLRLSGGRRVSVQSRWIHVGAKQL